MCSQERIANNHVFVFERKGHNKYSHSAEVKSVLENSTRNVSSLAVYFMAKPKSVTGERVIRAALPYIKQEIPVFIVFRAMGFVNDKEVLQHIVYDFNDAEMMDLLRPSIEEAFFINSEQLALDYIGKRSQVRCTVAPRKKQFWMFFTPVFGCFYTRVLCVFAPVLGVFGCSPRQLSTRHLDVWGLLALPVCFGRQS